MLKLKRYLKPYWVLLVCAMVFLFGQAMLELTLPNMMSDIVNTGIQQGGITEVGAQGHLGRRHGADAGFHVRRGRCHRHAAVCPRGGRGPPMAQAYPNLKAGDYVLKEDADTAAADTAFSRASYACVQVMQGLMAENGSAAQGQDGAASAGSRPAVAAAAHAGPAA